MISYQVARHGKYNSGLSAGLLMTSNVFGFHKAIAEGDGTNAQLSDFTSFLDSGGSFYLGEIVVEWVARLVVTSLGTIPIGHYWLVVQTQTFNRKFLCRKFNYSIR